MHVGLQRAWSAADGMAGALGRCTDAMTDRDVSHSLPVGWEHCRRIRCPGPSRSFAARWRRGCRRHLCRNRPARVVAPSVGAVCAVRALNTMIDGCSPVCAVGNPICVKKLFNIQTGMSHFLQGPGGGALLAYVGTANHGSRDGGGVGWGLGHRSVVSSFELIRSLLLQAMSLPLSVRRVVMAAASGRLIMGERERAIRGECLV